MSTTLPQMADLVVNSSKNIGQHRDEYTNQELGRKSMPRMLESDVGCQSLKASTLR